MSMINAKKGPKMSFLASLLTLVCLIGLILDILFDEIDIKVQGKGSIREL